MRKTVESIENYYIDIMNFKKGQEGAEIDETNEARIGQIKAKIMKKVEVLK